MAELTDEDKEELQEVYGEMCDGGKLDADKFGALPRLHAALVACLGM